MSSRSSGLGGNYSDIPFGREGHVLFEALLPEGMLTLKDPCQYGSEGDTICADGEAWYTSGTIRSFNQVQRLGVASAAAL